MLTATLDGIITATSILADLSRVGAERKLVPIPIGPCIEKSVREARSFIAKENRKIDMRVDTAALTPHPRNNGQ